MTAYDFSEDMHRSVAKALSEGLEYISIAAVSGDVAEFGVLQGNSAEVLARGMTACDSDYAFHLQRHGVATRRLHLFDSFSSFPRLSNGDLVDATSPHVQSGIWTDLAFENVEFSANQVRERCSPHLPLDRIVIYEGFFDQTLTQIDPSTKFALLHIDCDLYLSATQVLTHLFGNEMVADGCIVLFDDWNCNRASPSFGERRAWTECCQRFSLRVSDEGAYGPIGRKFIVHF